MKRLVSGILLTLLLVSVFVLASNIQPVKAEGTVYIRADGSIDPLTAPIYTVDNITYTLTGNVTSDADGIVVERSNVIIEGNGYTLQGSRALLSKGIDLTGRSNVTIKNMNIETFEVGINLIFSNNTIAGNNIIANSEYGIIMTYVSGGGESNIIFHNNFVNNTNQVGFSLASTLDVWDNGYPSGGNYWSDYTGVDADGDGIGDTPYIIDMDNQDLYPLMHPWSSRPIHNINTGLGYATIQEAINAPETLNGHTILVEPGTYHGQLTVNKTLSIIGSSSESTTISGSPSDCAVEIAADNVELSGFTICGGGFGLKVYSHNNNVHDNSIVENGFIGIYLYLSSGNTFTSNNVSRNGYGVSLVHSGGNAFKHNSIFENEWQELVIEGNTVSNFVEDMDTSNSVDGKPVYYWVNQQDKFVPSNAGYVALVDCRRILVQNLTFDRNGQGVLLAGTTDSMIENNALSTEYYGIYMVDSSNVTIRNCTIANCNFAMEIWFSNGNKIIGNNIVSNAYGVELAWSNCNNVSGNTIEQTSEYNGWGVCLSVSATGNQIYENDFAHNSQGMNIQLFYPGENKMYHNNFIQNAIQVYNYEPAMNVWDDGYPSGGNYWSDYVGVDLCSGSSQNESGSDGIGDTPNVIDSNNVDHYPLLGPWLEFGVDDVAVTSVVPDRTWVYQGFSANINVTVLNKGDFAENVNVTLYYNITTSEMIGTQNATIPTGENRTLSFVWDTMSVPYCHNYTITAVATIPLDNNPADNTLACGRIKVRIMGDLNGDDVVDGSDVALAAWSFGSYCPNYLYLGSQPSARWNLDADINGDGVVDGSDLILVARNFGK